MGKLSRRDFIPLLGSAVVGGSLLSLSSSKNEQEAEKNQFGVFPSMKRPLALQKGQTIGICAPAGAIRSYSEVEEFTAVLEGMGFTTKLGSNIAKRIGYFAGTDQERASDFMDLIEDSDVHAIFFIRGGWGSARLLSLLDFDVIKNNPKIIMGFSDATTLLNVITDKCKFITFHGPSGNSTWNDYSKKYIEQLLVEKRVVSYVNREEDHKITTYHDGSVDGQLWGGNLTVMTSLLGTSYFPDLTNAVLFLEDVMEEPYSIDRMLTQLKLAGVFEKVNGIILGNFRKCIAEEPDRSFTLEEVFEQHFSNFDKPVFFGAQIGHTRNKFTVPIGCHVRMNAKNGTIQLLERAVN